MDLLVDCPFIVFRITKTQLGGDVAADDLLTQIKTLYDLSGASSVIIDLGLVRYLSSVGLRPLLALRTAVGRTGGRVVLCGLQPNVAEVLKMTRLVSLEGGPTAAASLFPVAADVPAAVASLYQRK